MTTRFMRGVSEWQPIAATVDVLEMGDDIRASPEENVSVSDLPQVPGYSVHDGWLVRGTDLRRMPVLAEEPLRRYGLIDQLSDDVRDPAKAIGWVVSLLFLVNLLRGAWSIGGLGVVGIVVLGQEAWASARLIRYGRVVTIRLDRVDHDWGKKGVTDNIEVEGQALRIYLDPRVMKPLLQHGEVEAQVLFDVHASKTGAKCVAYRPAR